MSVGSMLGYCLVAAFIGIFGGMFADEVRMPDNTHVAVGFAIGALWPLSIVAGVCYCVLRAAIAVVRSFAALWRWWRPARVEVPRARQVRR